MAQKIWNSDFVDSLNELETISKNKGEIFRARAYKTASDTILAMSEEIYDVNQLKDEKGIGKTIFEKLKVWLKLVKLMLLKEKNQMFYMNYVKYMGLDQKKR